jgi:hypothetical protein
MILAQPEANELSVDLNFYQAYIQTRDVDLVVSYF